MKPSIIRLLISAVLSTAALGFLSSCHTAEGFGEDVQHAGRGIERAADRAH